MTRMRFAPRAGQRTAPSFFGVVDEGSVRRRPSDVVGLLAAGLLIAGCVAAKDGFTAGPDSFYRWLTELPSWLGTAGTWLFVLCTAGALAVIAIALLVAQRVRTALILVVVGALTAVVSYALERAIDVDALRRAASDAESSLSSGSVVWLAVTTAVLLVAAPYIVRPARRSVRAVQVLAVIGAAAAAIAPLAAILAAVGVGWGISAIVSLVIGTPRASPTVESVLEALGELGIPIDHLVIAERQTWGETRFHGRTSDGRPASLVVIGRDGAEVHLASKVYRSIVYRDAGPSIAVTRMAQLEHRAYMVLLAHEAGVPVGEVVMAATAGSDGLAFLALVDPDGTRLSTFRAGDVTDTTLEDAWASLARLHEAQLAHGQVGPDNILVADDGTIALLDFSHGSAGASAERRLRDRVDLLVSTAAAAGDDRALTVAVQALGAGGVAELLPYLEPAALSPAARRAVTDPKAHLKALREAAATASGSDLPDLVELRRVSPSSVLMAAATFLGFYLIVNQFAGVDMRATLAGASWSWVAVTFGLSVVPNFSGSVSLMGAVSRPMPFKPVLAEQFANNFTGLIGGTVATTALVIRFFQKQGMKAAVAASSGVMNSLAAGIVQIILIALGLLFADGQFSVSDVGGGGGGRTILIVILVVAVAVTIAMHVPKLRGWFTRSVAPQIAAARENLGAILKSPRNAVMIFGGNLCSQVAFALVLSASLRAFDVSVPLSQLIIINSLASLVGGLAPVPGGMGVIEAGQIAGMTAVGVPESVAVAAVFTGRLFTAYLPPIWGWMALQWLRKGDYV